MNALVDMYPRVMRVIELLSQGYTLTKACRDQCITTTAFNRYVRTAPELKELHEEALQEGHDTMADILLEMETNPVYGSSDPQKMKIISENIKWLLSRRRPSQYGDKVTVEHNVTADAAIVEMLARGRDRANSLMIEEAEYVDVTPTPAFDPSQFS